MMNRMVLRDKIFSFSCVFQAEADSRMTSSALDLLTIESPAVDSDPNSASTSPSITASAQNGTANGINGTTPSNGTATGLPRVLIRVEEVVDRFLFVGWDVPRFTN